MKVTGFAGLFIALCMAGWLLVSWLLMLFIGIARRVLPS